MMHTKLFFSLISLLCWFTVSSAQVGIKSYGATIFIPKGKKIDCQGNLEFQAHEGQSTKLILDGEVNVKGTLINHAPSYILATFPDLGGKIRFSSSQRQYFRGAESLTVPRISIDNPEGLHLRQNLTLSQSLHFIQGKVYTDSNQLKIRNPDSLAIVNFGPENYVVGNLRRYVQEGKITFPIGTDSHLQLLDLHFERIPSSPFVDVSFSKERPVFNQTLEVDGGRIIELLDNGVWTLSAPIEPNVNFTLSLRAQGHTNAGVAAAMHTLIQRKGFEWKSVGQMGNTIGSGSSAITSSRHSINSWGDFAIGKAAYILSNPSLLPISSLRVSNNGSHNRVIRLNFLSQTSGEYTLELRDSRGGILKEWTSFAIAGDNEKQVDLHSFPKGVYLLILRKGDADLARKVW